MRILTHRVLPILTAAIFFSCASSPGFMCSYDSDDIGPRHVTATWETASVQMAPQWSPNGLQIVFTARPPGEYFLDTRIPGGVWPRGIWSVGTDGSGLRTVLDEPKLQYVYDHSPRISQDGSHMVYSTTRNGITDKTQSAVRNYEVETSRLDGSERRQLTDSNFQDVSPTWSPDGTLIAFAKVYPASFGRDTESGIYVVNADGSGLSQVFPFFVTAPYGKTDTYSYRRQIYRGGLEWSPNGEFVAFASHSLHERQDILYVVKADGSEHKVLYLTLPNRQRFVHRVEQFLSWSPDGNSIAFMTNRLKGTEEYPSAAPKDGELPVEIYGEPMAGPFGYSLLAVNIDGSGLRELATDLPISHRKKRYSPPRSLAWSPDGRRILFTDSHISPGNVYITGLDGNSLQKVTEGLYASWSPDGSQIAVVDPDSMVYLKIVSPDGMVKSIVETTSLSRNSDGYQTAANGS